MMVSALFNGGAVKHHSTNVSVQSECSEHVGMASNQVKLLKPLRGGTRSGAAKCREREGEGEGNVRGGSSGTELDTETASVRFSVAAAAHGAEHYAARPHNELFRLLT